METEVTFEDGRTGQIRADMAIVAVATGVSEEPWVLILMMILILVASGCVRAPAPACHCEPTCTPRPARWFPSR